MKLFNLIFRTLIIPLALIAIIVGILSFADLSIPMESARGKFINKLSSLTGKEVRIEGNVRLAINFFPTLVVNDLHIQNTGSWHDEDIFTISKARVQIALLPLFSSKLEIIEIAVKNIQINLQQAKDGSQNWQSFTAPENTTDAAENTEPTDEQFDKAIWLEKLILTNLSVKYVDEKIDQTFVNQINTLIINTHEKTFLTAELQGTSKGIPYVFSARSDLLRSLVNNKPWKMSMKGQVSDRPVSLNININTIRPELSGTVTLNAERFDIGSTLSWLNLVEGLDAYSSSLLLTTHLNGHDLDSLIKQSTLSLDLNDGYIVLHDPADKDFQKLNFASATLLSKPARPVSLKFSGDLDNELISAELSTEELSAFFTDLKKVHLGLKVNIAKSNISFNGNIELPVNRKSYNTDIYIKGKKLNHWNGLLNSSIPPFGPYELKGSISFDPKGLKIQNATLKIGNSDLGGRIFINTSGNKSHWDMDLVSELVQLDDFRVEDYSLFPETMGYSPDADGQINAAAGTMMKAESNTTLANTYPNTNATLKLESRQVLSGKDDLGRGKLHLNIAENSITVDSFNLDIPGGAVEGEMMLERSSEGVSGQLVLNADKFDYGILYRFIDPDFSFNGLISTRIKLNLAGIDTGNLLDKANGEIDFSIWPKNLGAGVLNIWSVNLFLALLPELNKKESKLNCATALLDIKDGQLTEELLFIDSTKLWMKGNVSASFPEEKISVALFPAAKKAKLFGLQVPIRLRGSFTDIGVTVKPFDIVTAYVSFITSPLHVPFRRAFGKKAGADLSELCGELLDRDYLKALLDEMEQSTPSLDEMYE